MLSALGRIREPEMYGRVFLRKTDPRIISGPEAVAVL
jgi:hypothetical protein